MASIIRVKMRWSGFTGSPGYTNFHFRDFSAAEPTVAEADAAVDRVETFIGAIKVTLPPAVQLVVASDVDVIEETNGTMINVLTATPAAAQNGTNAGTGGYSAATGAVINWRTDGIRRGRRIRGRTFLVPLAGAGYETNGSLVATTISSLATAAAALASPTGAPDLGVWARPTPSAIPGGEPTPDGVWYAVTGSNVPDLAAVLRSRRD